MAFHHDDSSGIFGSPLIGSPSHRSDGGDTTAGSINLAQLEQQHHWATMQSGTIEVPDTVPKREYYASLRRFGTLGGGRVGSISGGSMIGSGGVNGGAMLSPVTAIGSPYPSATMGRTVGTLGRSNTSVSNFKPSGKSVECAIIMLDGLQQIFNIDKAAYGQQLFDAVCGYLDLFEVDFFGIKYFAPDNTMCWLKLDKRIAKQVGKNWLFEFQVKFFPYNMDSLTEDLTRYFLCLQVRQNLLSGQLPCSFFSYVILGSYIVQSDAGDYDPKLHQGVAYIRGHPFAPQHLQNDEMLYRIAETHRLHHGQTPECADSNFLMNAKKMALYGVHMHKVTSSSGVEHGLGVYFGGLLLYLNRIRTQRFSWPRIIKLSYRKRSFIIMVRPLEGDQNERTYVFRCNTAPMAKRLWQLCVEHHNFFRLRGYERSKKPSVLPGFQSRKYTYGQNNTSGRSVSVTSIGELSPKELQRPQPAVRRLQPQRKQISTPDQAWFTLPHGANASGNFPYGTDISQYQYSAQIQGMNPSQTAYSAEWDATNAGLGNNLQRNTMYPAHQNGTTAIINGGSGEAAVLGAGDAEAFGLTPRPMLKPEPWRISTADRTRCLGIDDLGVDIAAQQGAGWQGCRCNKGVKAPGSYYFEATVLEEGPVGVGWATNDASLVLGEDDHGLIFGNTDASNHAVVSYNGQQFDFSQSTGVKNRLEVKKGDVVGCLLNLDHGVATWSCNGAESSQVLHIPERLHGDVFFPAAGLKNSRILINFGETPLEFMPKSCLPLASVPEGQQVANANCGWRLNAYDATSGLDVQPDGMIVQASWGEGWQGCRANRGVKGEGRFYFEARVLESNGLARIGWTTEDGRLVLGTDRCGFGYGADADGFGLNGLQGKRMHNNEIDNYGESFGEGDIIGCFLDLTQRTLKWAKNGHTFGDAYRLPVDFNAALGARRSGEEVAFFPTVSLLNSTVQFNFGDSQFGYFPGPDWTPLSYVALDNIQMSSSVGPKHKGRGWSYIEPHTAVENSNILKPSVERREDDLETVNVPKMHLAGGIPMPGMTVPPRSPKRTTAVVVNLHSSPTNGQSNLQGKNHHPGEEQHLVERIDGGTQLNPPIRHLVGSPIPLNGGGVNESVTVLRSPPTIKSECYEDKNGKIIKRTTKKTQIVTTKTFSEHIVQPEAYLAVSDEHDQAFERALLKATRLDPDVQVMNTNLNAVHRSVVPSKKVNGNATRTPASFGDNC